MSDFSYLSEEAAEWTEYAKTWTAPVPPAGATPQQIRAAANTNTAKLFDAVVGRPADGLTVTEHTVGESSIPVRVYRPTAAAGDDGLAVYIFFHGGGYFLGSLDTEDANCRHLALQTGVAVVNVNYRHTPEHVFPSASDDAWAVFQWVASQGGAGGDGLKLDTSRIVVGGISAGATLAISVALKAAAEAQSQSQPVVRPRGLVLTTPATVHPDHFPADSVKGEPSLVAHSDAPFINAARLRGFMALYQPTPPTHPAVSPLLVDGTTLAALRLERVAVHVAGRDPLRDEGLLFEAKLRAAGVPTTLYTYPGLPHAFMSHPKLASTQVWRERMWEDVKSIANE
ncbi:hypothetical protein SPBR_07579 [Sporothrix brasiliensis 5110]|uniref:Alpha/beta hydrolase fold-3 domain-containing protein n=1 Tax=Sporothrix brasiliensis 5110 TaxID=1398154 RepID=A0A0C2IH73_9PEZI|nr:uncharacterized protein SPBR_07579 [Sporothrix brasiliensis 5110]KIH88556.1 hypothetical protein SPBR_07579 [Sporothrix brasiliensis 5110]